MKKCFPIVGSDCVQRFDHIVQRVRLDLWRTAWSACKGPAEVVDRLTALRLRANDCVGLEPNQSALLVKVHAAPQRFPVRSRIIQQLGSNSRVLQRSPTATSTIVKHRSIQCQKLPIEVRCDQPAPSSKNPAEIFGEALIYPKEIAFHRLLIVPGGETFGPAILAVP